MRTVFLIFVLFTASLTSPAQTKGFPFGKVTYRELEMKTYDKDTSAFAVVLNESGEAYIEDENHYNLVFKHHLKIKILKKGGLEYGDFEIMLRKNEGSTEILRSVTASTFNAVNGPMEETKLNPKNVYTENINKYRDIKKFALPNVRVGSVIEVEYELESPFIRNFRNWEFQSEIPKVKSEFFALIPANYHYNILLRGFLKLSKNESTLVKDCFTAGGSGKADCGQMVFGITDIPAFKDEDYMTARSNFISAITFELSEINYFDGRKDKLTIEWKDAEEELRRDSKFGVQLKRGEDIVDRKIESLLAGETEPLEKAKKIYDFIKQWYKWNDVYGEYSEFGIKKAFESKVGNVGDINLSLIAALKYAGLNAEPLLLSTRENGSVTELHPVLSDFNYVIAKLNINDKVYLLDATEDFLSFGLIPERCLNGKGRVLGDKVSYWHELKAPDRQKQISVQKLKMDTDATIRGTIQNSYFGYEAMNQRKKLHRYGNQKEFVDHISSGWNGASVTKYTLENTDDLTKPMIVSLDVEIDAYKGLNNFLLNPFFVDRWTANPFKSSERFYPVDFGAPLEEIVIFTLEYPETFVIDEIPGNLGLSLPGAGGRYIFKIQNAGTILTMNSSLLINKPVFGPDEYHYLKELFSRVVSTQQTDLVINRKE